MALALHTSPPRMSPTIQARPGTDRVSGPRRGPRRPDSGEPVWPSGKAVGW